MKRRRINNRIEKDVWMGIWHLSMLLFFLIFFVFIHQPKNPIWNFNWKNIRPEIKDSTMVLYEKVDIDDRQSNFTERHTTIIRNQTSRWVSKNATKKELLELLEFPSAQVKLSAYFGLLTTDNPNNLEIIEKLLNDTTQFYTESYGCLSHSGLICEKVFSRKFAVPILNIEITTEGFRRLGINQTKMEELLLIYENRVTRRDDIIYTAATKYHFFD